MILVDWREGAAAFYTTSKDNAIKTGKKVGSFIKTSGIDPNNIYCIGHSLGAHVNQKYFE